MILESEVERHLKQRLDAYGFKVLKLTTPGTQGVPDRMILRPRYSPGPPMFVELKRPGKKLRELQKRVGEDWLCRGCMVLVPCTSIGEVDQLCTMLIDMVMPDYAFYRGSHAT
jgi:hypothetical protein